MTKKYIHTALYQTRKKIQTIKSIQTPYTILPIKNLIHNLKTQKHESNSNKIQRRTG